MSVRAWWVSQLTSPSEERGSRHTRPRGNSKPQSTAYLPLAQPRSAANALSHEPVGSCNNDDQFSRPGQDGVRSTDTQHTQSMALVDTVHKRSDRADLQQTGRATDETDGTAAQEHLVRRLTLRRRDGLYLQQPDKLVPTAREQPQIHLIKLLPVNVSYTSFTALRALRTTGRSLNRH